MIKKIKIEEKEYLYYVEDNTIFVDGNWIELTNSYTDLGNYMDVTLDKVTHTWISNKIDICPKPTAEEKLQELMEQVELMDTQISELMLII